MQYYNLTESEFCQDVDLHVQRLALSPLFQLTQVAQVLLKTESEVNTVFVLLPRCIECSAV